MTSVLRSLAWYSIIILMAKPVENALNSIDKSSENDALRTTLLGEERDDVMHAQTTISEEMETFSFEPVDATTAAIATEDKLEQFSGEATTLSSKETVDVTTSHTKPSDEVTTVSTTPSITSTAVEMSSHGTSTAPSMSPNTVAESSEATSDSAKFSTTTELSHENTVESTISTTKSTRFTSVYISSTSPMYSTTAETPGEKAVDSTIFTKKSSNRATRAYTVPSMTSTTEGLTERVEGIDSTMQPETTTTSVKAALKFSTTSSQPTSSEDRVCMDLLRTKFNRSDCTFYRRLCRRRGLEDYMRRTCPVTCGYCKMCLDDMKSGLCTQSAVERMCNNRNPRIRAATRAKCPVTCGICSPGTVLVLR